MDLIVQYRMVLKRQVVERMYALNELYYSHVRFD